MARNSHSPAASSGQEPAVTTETFQKHYGRGTGYPPDERSHHHGHHHPPPPHHGYPSSQHHYGGAPGQHPPPPPPHHYNGHHGHGGPPPPPPPGYHHHPSWYYPPHAAAAAAAPSEPSRRSSSRASKNPSSMPIPLVTPKSHDSEALPPAPPVENANSSKGKKSPAKPTGKKGSKKKDKNAKAQAAEKEPEMEEEPQVDPMKQDFHYYAVDHYEEVKQECQKELDDAIADGSISLNKGKENQLFLLTTLLNNRLIQNWENAPPATRATYLKKEEADRKRFMSEEEVASRHCATLTARRRSPKQSGALGMAGSFGLVSTLEVPPTPVESSSMKRPNSELMADAEVLENAAKRVKC